MKRMQKRNTYNYDFASFQSVVRDLRPQALRLEVFIHLELLFFKSFTNVGRDYVEARDGARVVTYTGWHVMLPDSTDFGCTPS
jgi:hypothetical protein